MSVSVSFEFTPPYNPAAAHHLQDCAKKLLGLKHDFICVNFGGGLVPSGRSVKTLVDLRGVYHSNIIAHLSPVGLTKIDIADIALSYKRKQIKKIFIVRNRHLEMAKQGDDYYHNSLDMMRSLVKIYPFEYIICGFPEGTPAGYDARNNKFDPIRDIQEKIDAGAKSIITQFCFDNEKIVRFRDKLAAKNIFLPIRVGILPVSDMKKVSHLAAQYNISLDLKQLDHLSHGLKMSDPSIMTAISAYYTALQCQGLKEYGFNKLHFYTMNDISVPLCAALLMNICYEGNQKNACDIPAYANYAKTPSTIKPKTEPIIKQKIA